MIFLTGGARSGKSAIAIDLARRYDGPVRYIVTARPSDEEMERRIAQHRRLRPESWDVVEAPIAVGEAVATAGAGDLVVIDCITLWISNLMVGHEDSHILEAVDDVVALVSERDPYSIVVSNEVGSGIVPMDPVGRRFRDLQGTANQRFAAIAELAYLVVAGRTLELDDHA